MTRPRSHSGETESLARQLDPRDVYDWLVTAGYFPECYVLPPCFHVSRHPKYGRRYTRRRGTQFRPRLSQICELHFPRTELTDRTFGIIDPEVHSDIASEIASEWGTILDLLFHPRTRIYSYSFPLPVSSRTPGTIASLRAGRMIYEWIEMVESDLVEEAYAYKYVVRTDVKSFYPSVYTHSIAWALHSRQLIRSGSNRHNFALLGNRLDRLFQAANDGCTNGLPIGPVVSDLIAEVILSAVDLEISTAISNKEILAVRFKDDYRFLCKSKEHCTGAAKALQKGLKAFGLLLNEEKTEVADLPEGIFRGWVSKYEAIRPQRGQRLGFREFRRLYSDVLQIDRQFPGTGLIDKFIMDLVDKSYTPLLNAPARDMGKTISLLLLLAERRSKAFPRILGLVEALMGAAARPQVTAAVERHLNGLLKDLTRDPDDNRYLISWILYFLKSNGLAVRVPFRSTDPILMSIRSNQNRIFQHSQDFKLFRGARAARQSGALLKHLDVFKQQ